MTSDPFPGRAPKRVCIDASLVLHLILPDERDSSSESLWLQWAATGVEVIGPALLHAEVTSVIRLRVATGRLTDDEGEATFTSKPGVSHGSFRRVGPTI
jgi:predicted nucleic acid-binding protein